MEKTIRHELGDALAEKVGNVVADDCLDIIFKVLRFTEVQEDIFYESFAGVTVRFFKRGKWKSKK